MQNDKHAIKTARVKLLRAMDKAIGDAHTAYYGYKELRRMIAADHNAMLSYSLEYDGKVSYAREAADRYNGKRRVAVSFAKYVRRVYKEAVLLSDSELGWLAGKVTAAYVNHEPFIELLTGDAIVTAYRSENFGLGSCMEDTDYVQFYADNPDKVSLLTYQIGRKGRALVWSCDCGTRVLDRIYKPDNGPQIDAIRAYAMAHGIKIAADLGNEELARLKVTMRHSETFHYLDTFWKGQYTISGKVCLHTRFYTGRADLELQQTDGTDGSEGHCCCEDCECELSEDNCYYSDYAGPYCESCYRQRYSFCDRCDRDRDADGFEDVTTTGYGGRVQQESWCEYCAKEHSMTCDKCEERFDNDLLAEHDKLTGWYCPDCLKEELEELDTQEELELEKTA